MLNGTGGAAICGPSPGKTRLVRSGVDMPQPFVTKIPTTCFQSPGVFSFSRQNTPFSTPNSIDFLNSTAMTYANRSTRQQFKKHNSVVYKHAVGHFRRCICALPQTQGSLSHSIGVCLALQRRDTKQNHIKKAK